MISGNDSNVYAPNPQPPSTHLYASLKDPRESSFDQSSRDSSPLSHGFKNGDRIGVDYREVARTPSPTPSEAEALAGKTRSCNLSKFIDPTYLKNPKNILTLVITAIIIGGLIAFMVLQDKIIVALQPFSDWMRRTPGAWLIPIAIMIVISFPPLFGHELVAALVGDVYGLGIGFAIVAAGTIIGELVTFFTFRYCCAARAKKTEEKILKYALLSQVIREGGLKMALIVRYSSIPGHMTTAIFASCGMNLVTFLLAAFLSLPKQFATVYVGIGQTNNTDDASKKRNQIIKIIVIVITVIMTLVAMRYINTQIDAIKNRVIYERRKARQAKLQGFTGPSSVNVDLEDAATQPLVGRGPASSMDDATMRPPAADAQYTPPNYPPPGLTATAPARYDDPYDGKDAFAVGGLRPLHMLSPAPSLGSSSRSLTPRTHP